MMERCLVLCAPLFICRGCFHVPLGGIGRMAAFWELCDWYFFLRIMLQPKTFYYHHTSVYSIDA